MHIFRAHERGKVCVRIAAFSYDPDIFLRRHAPLSLKQSTRQVPGIVKIRLISASATNTVAADQVPRVQRFDHSAALAVRGND